MITEKRRNELWQNRQQACLGEKNNEKEEGAARRSTLFQDVRDMTISIAAKSVRRDLYDQIASLRAAAAQLTEPDDRKIAQLPTRMRSALFRYQR